MVAASSGELGSKRAMVFRWDVTYRPWPYLTIPRYLPRCAFKSAELTFSILIFCTYNDHISVFILRRDLVGGIGSNVPVVDPRFGQGGEDAMEDANSEPARLYRIQVELP